MSLGTDMAAKEERAACAELVRKAGCPRECREADHEDGNSLEIGDSHHRPWCPMALAAAIEART